jgi:peptidoglycan hydrolase-like protein with peptidoglycan-binding domain
MANPGQPAISLGAAGDVVKRLQRALRRTRDHSISIDGVFGPQLEAAVKLFQEGQLTVDAGPMTSKPMTVVWFAGVEVNWSYFVSTSSDYSG